MAETPVHLTYDNAVIDLERAVMERGADYKFVPADSHDANTYFYFDPESGEPGCIVGQVLSYHGVTKEQLGRLNTGTGFGGVLRSRTSVVTCDPEAKTLLMTAQDEQDAGATWGEAVNTAVEYVEDHIAEIKV